MLEKLHPNSNTYIPGKISFPSICENTFPEIIQNKCMFGGKTFWFVLINLFKVIIARKVNLRKCWSQFSLGGICKQSVFVKYSKRLKALNFDNFHNSHNSYLWPEYFIDYFCENGFHISLWHLSCVYFSAQRQFTAVQKIRNRLK